MNGDINKQSNSETPADATFSEHIPYIETLTLSIGGYFDGNEVTTIHFVDNQAVYEKKHFPPAPIEIDQSLEDITMPKDKFLKKLASLHIENWQEDYVNMDVMDGTQWGLEVHFSDGHQALSIGGSNAYPPKFKSLLRLLKIK